MAAAAAGEPLGEERTRRIVTEFMQEGGALIPSVLTTSEIDAIRAITDDHALHPERYPASRISYAGTAFVLRRGREADPIFGQMLDREPIRSLVEAILGQGARPNAVNVIRNGPGQAISRWHVDDVVEFPLPDDVPRFDPRLRMPVLWFTAQCALSDIDAIEHGPTQYVPGSHYSGRHPNSQEEPVFDGRGPRSVFCKAGDIYLTNHQAWHRGAPNTSDRVRYVMQLQYAARWAEARFRGDA
jgi:hypothetical protein